jgi:hypothetical protein
VAEVTEDLEDRLRQTEAALEEAIAERNRLWAELQRNNAALEDLDHVRAMVTSMQSSVSWRVTQPIRGVKTTVGPRLDLVRRNRRKAAARLKNGS